MRCLFTLLLLLFASNLEAQRIINSYAFGTNSTLNTGLVAYWKLEEASGTRIDSEPTPTAQDLTDNNTVTSVAGKIGNAAFFTAANSESLSHADSSDLSVGNIDFTIAAWAKATTLTSGANIASHYLVAAGERAWRLWFNSSLGKFEFTVSNDGDAIAVATATSFGTPVTNVWYFVAAWHDSTNNIIGISVNDGTKDTTAYTLGVYDSPGLFVIGARDSPADFWDGTLDEVGFWKKTLTAAEITSLYNAGAGRTCCGF